MRSMKFKLWTAGPKRPDTCTMFYSYIVTCVYHYAVLPLSSQSNSTCIILFTTDSASEKTLKDKIHYLKWNHKFWMCFILALYMHANNASSHAAQILNLYFKSWIKSFYWKRWQMPDYKTLKTDICKIVLKL